MTKPDAPDTPAQGGSYTRDPDSGELSLVQRTAPAEPGAKPKPMAAALKKPARKEKRDQDNV